jgi:hypothetical protein
MQFCMVIPIRFNCSNLLHLLLRLPVFLSKESRILDCCASLFNQSAMYKINFWNLLGCFLLIMLLAYFSFMGAWADEDGNAETILEKVLSASFNIFRFPTHTLFWKTFQSGYIFIYGLMFNSLLYAFVCERIITYLQRNKKLRKQKTQANGL